MIPDSSNPAYLRITIVVPVFRNLAVTRNCLESLIASNLPDNASITVIDDSSPEEELSAYCRGLAAEAGFRLIVNESNLGFVKTANKGFSLDPEADILLLNSDTVVSKNWLQRLQACAYSETDIGTVTPFSNNGTICSYPVFSDSNSLPTHWTAAELDHAFQVANTGTYGEIPTAIGFCMYIKRSCLNETGIFDEANFGHGYGEECDFSLRASASGWKHVVAADVFVYHEGGASFASESTKRKHHADKMMHGLHPHYHQLITNFLLADPLYNLRKNVDAVRLKDKPEDSVAILEEHSRYTRTILERVADSHRAMLSEQQQRLHLDQMLGECRNQFAKTDQALSEAQKVVDDLKVYLDNAQIYAQHLKEHIRNLEQSRSWRYTAWLRRK